MIKRNYDENNLMETMKPYLNDLEGFYPELWLADKTNVCLTDCKGNFTLFERELPEVVIGHYFLKARGREALNLCKEFLKEIFTGPYNVSIIQGVTPLDKPGALWMNRQLGFKPREVINTVAGQSQLVILTKKEWETRQDG